jgi:hypothetical protein
MPAGNKIFMTLWDGGGNDTYDFSNYTSNLSVNLAPGAWTTVSTTQLAALGGGHVAAGNIANALLYNGNPASLIENAIGGAGNDTMVGNAADNRLTGGAGNDALDGGVGTDTAVFSGNLADYSQVQNADGSWTVTDLRGGHPDGTDALTSIEFLQFKDQLVALGDDPAPPDPPDPPGNTAPTAANDSYGTTAGTKLVVAAGAGVLANDGDADGDALSAILVSGPSHGSLTLNSNGSFSFTPTAGFTGTDSFTYKVNDGSTDSGVATATITVDPLSNVAPVAVNDSYATARRTKLTVSAANGVLANDGDADGDHLSAILVSGPSRSQGSLKLNADGSFVFTPNSRFTGTASFKYKVSDGEAESAVATATIAVSARGRAPLESGHDHLGDGVPSLVDDQMPMPARTDWATRHPDHSVDWSIAALQHAHSAFSDGDDGLGVSDMVDPQPMVDLIGLPDHHHAFHADFASI